MDSNGDWGLGIGDWGLGIGPNPQSPIPINIKFIRKRNDNKYYIKFCQKNYKIN